MYVILYSRFGTGMGPTILDRVQCRGSESSLFQCPYSVEVGETHVSNSVGIECSKCQCVQLHVQTAAFEFGLKENNKTHFSSQQLPLSYQNTFYLVHVPYKYYIYYIVALCIEWRHYLVQESFFSLSR